MTFKFQKGLVKMLDPQVVKVRDVCVVKLIY